MRSKLKPALLALEDGSLFQGQSCGAEGIAVGEVVFNTAITGYQEILTDPSYARQIVTLTYPQIGNTGVNPEDVESARVSAAGLVIRQLPRRASSWRQRMTLPEFLREQEGGGRCGCGHQALDQAGAAQGGAGRLHRRWRCWGGGGGGAGAGLSGP